ncbi:TPA: hypothetical protein NJY08_005156 [Salmonella enterica subsp. enterica serovar Typhi str. AG3]|nr:hypothetical protein [Salmonella enterica subsp. enterica serovar Typhi str. AG3]
MKDAFNRADLVAEINIEEKLKEIDEEPVPYTVFSATVEKVYHGNIKDRKITIKQQGNTEWSFNGNALFNSGEKYILFLKEATVSEANYWIIGEETGMFKITDSDTIVKLADRLEELKDIEKNNANKLLETESKGRGQVIDKEKLSEKIQELGE